MAFAAGEGPWEILGLPTLGNTPLKGTGRISKKYLFDETRGMLLLAQFHYSAAIDSSRVTAVSEPALTRAKYECRQVVPPFRTVISYALGIKQHRGDNYGNLVGYTNLLKNDNPSDEMTVWDATDGEQLAGYATKESTLTRTTYTQVLVGTPPYVEHVVALGGSVARQDGEEVYTILLEYYPYSQPIPGSTAPPSTGCDICVVRVPGKQWPGQLPTTTISSSGRSGCHQRFLDLRNKQRTTKGTREKASTRIKMEVSKLSQRIQKSPKNLVRQIPYIGPPL